MSDKDTIYRQDAIDAADRADYTGLAVEDVKKVTDEVVKEIKKLPSAQPEIIRCKDCKHHWTHRCMDSMPKGICELDQTFYDANVDFCSLAERRTDEDD